MIILDTNVISEGMRPNPEPRVIKWLDDNTAQPLAVTAVSIAELLYGIRRLPQGRRRSSLQTAFDNFMSQGLEGRMLPFDGAAADLYSQIVIARARGGRRIEVFDAMIAAIARVSGADIATRDVSDFEECGVRVVNPWE